MPGKSFNSLLNVTKSPTAKFRTFVLGVAVFVIVASLQGLLFDEFTWAEFVGGAMKGALIGICIMSMELVVFPSRGLRWLNRFPLSILWLIRIGAWLAVILTLMTLTGIPLNDPEWIATSIVSLLLAPIAAIVLTLQRLVGHHTLLNLLTGRYYRPQRKSYVILLIDLDGSTAIAERIGHTKYFSLLNSFVSDVGEQVRKFGGEIYKYVGDEVIAVWPIEDSAEIANAVNCWAAIQHDLLAQRPNYEEKFDVAPHVHAAIHHGEMTVGQIGSYRQEVAILGEPLNVASRFLEFASSQKLDLVVSKSFEAMSEDERFVVTSLGEKYLRGVATPFDLFSVKLT